MITFKEYLDISPITKVIMAVKGDKIIAFSTALSISNKGKELNSKVISIEKKSNYTKVELE